MKAVGIDPGTKSMDICAIKNQKIVYESCVPTKEVAKNPKKLIDELEKAEPFDVLAAPSGYGIEPTNLKRIPQEKLEEWYYNYILLTQKKYIEEAVEKNVFGALLYYAMTQAIKEIKKRDYKTIFIPGIINLPTVPIHRKYNKLDMGTADKLAVTALATHQQTKNKPNFNTSFILIEMGFGYNSVIAVEKGKIIDGIGGTTIQAPGFLTLGGMDAELTQLGKNWQKQHIFQGGLSTITRHKTPKQLLNNLDNKKERNALKSMLEGVEKAVRSIKSTTKTNKTLLSGRLTKKPQIKKRLTNKLKDYDVRVLDDLLGARETKKTSQGYALVANGLSGGSYKELIEHLEIDEAKGSCIDYIKHPKAKEIREEFVKFK
ncbi:DUF1464 domain-containing protein [archaeon SCG-AAA382B04]|nr:DUF1464 domain-containing protein [archaeon SCG-AAA382B04]